MIDIVYRNVLVKDNYVTGDIGYANATYKTLNVVGDNWKIDLSTTPRTLDLIRKLKNFLF